MNVAASLAHPSAGYPVLVAVLQVPVLTRLLIHPPPVDLPNGPVNAETRSKMYRVSQKKGGLVSNRL